MGFRTGTYAKIWSIQNKGKFHKANISTSKKNRDTGEYVTDFSEFVAFIGNAHKDAAKLRPGDRIKIGDCDATTTYDAEKKITYHNYAIYSFELPDATTAPQQQATQQPAAQQYARQTPYVTANDDPF